MIKLLNILTEIANSSYILKKGEVRNTTNFETVVDYTFKTATGRDYYVRFNSNWVGRSKRESQKYNWATEMTFMPVEHKTTPDTEVGGENFGKILATVGEALKEYIQDYKPEYVFWKGIKGHGEKNPGESTKRHRIYNALMDKIARQIPGYSPAKGPQVSGLIINREVPVQEADKILKYPEQPTYYDEKAAAEKVSRFNLKRN